jgi:hypothetical protein
MIEYVGTPLRSTEIMGHREHPGYLSFTLAIIISLWAGVMPGGTVAFWSLKDRVPQSFLSPLLSPPLIFPLISLPLLIYVGRVSLYEVAARERRWERKEGGEKRSISYLPSLVLYDNS